MDGDVKTILQSQFRLYFFRKILEIVSIAYQLSTYTLLSRALMFVNVCAYNINSGLDEFLVHHIS